MTKKERAKVLCHKLKDFLKNFNLFPSAPPSTDQHELRIQRISTRLVIFLFILALIILLLYTSLESVTKTINIKTPTLMQYSQLYSKYSQTLTCPCTQISINYEKFLHVEYTLHQVCSSIFVSDKWISYLLQPVQDYYYPMDFRLTGVYAFEALNGFCQLIQQTISNSLIQFNSTQYITGSVTSLQLFQVQTQLLTDQFRSSIINNFLLSLNMIRNTTEGNHLLSGLYTNYWPYTQNTDGFFYIQMSANSYPGCDCSLSSKCIEPFSIYSNYDETRVFNVSGFYRGCYMIESLLQSTLECFYDQNCIDGLKVYLSQSSTINATALDSSLPSNYSEYSTIADLLNNLMIEQWNLTQMYDRYYNECQPTQCSYTVPTRNNVIYIITTLLGVVGGLITVLKLVTPRFVKFIAYCIRKWKMRVAPQITTVQR